jgi:hypothetical protein
MPPTISEVDLMQEASAQVGVGNGSFRLLQPSCRWPRHLVGLAASADERATQGEILQDAIQPKSHAALRLPSR